MLAEEASLIRSTVLIELGRWTEAREGYLDGRRIALEDSRPQGPTTTGFGPGRGV